MPCSHHGAGKMAVPVEEEGVCNRSLTLADYAKGVMFTVYSWRTLHVDDDDDGRFCRCCCFCSAWLVLLD